MRFRLKMMLGMLCLLAVLFGIGGSLLIALSFESSLDREEESARESYRMLLDTLSVVGSLDVWSQSEDIPNMLDQLYDRSGSSWLALRFSTTDEILYESGPTAIGFESDRAGIDADHGVVLTRSDGEGGWYLQLSGTCAVNGEPHYLDALYDISPLYQTRSHQQAVFRVVFAVLIALCALLAYGLSWLLTRPLSKLTRATREIASGNLSFRSNVRSDDEIGDLSTSFDVMAQRVEGGVTEMKRSLERQERFMGGFAHEVKTPMTAIIGYADLIRTQTLDPHEQIEAAGFIFSEGKRLENLSLKLLDIFVLGKTEVQLVVSSPAELVADAVGSLELAVASRGRAVLIEEDCERGTCLLEPDLVQSLLLNLIDNACKAVGDRGAVKVTCTMLPDGCRLRVADDGAGIPAEALDHISEAFYRVDASRSRAQGGSGLGLSLCAKIAELHRGSLSVESEIGVGTSVTVDLRGGREVRL